MSDLTGSVRIYLRRLKLAPILCGLVLCAGISAAQAQQSEQNVAPNVILPNQTQPNQTQPNQTQPNQTQPNQNLPEATWRRQEVAVLRAMDKVTARISSVTAPIDQPVKFGALEIVVRSCQDRPPTETPENAAFLQIDELLPDEAPKRLFSGWMFASSPALNALEHPVYDIWVHACRSAETASESSSPS